MTEIQNAGVLRTNRYFVSFAPPKYLVDKISSSNLDKVGSSMPLDRITLRCESAQIPGMSLATIDGPPRPGYGPIEAIPYGTIFDDITLSFIVDSRSDIHKFFYEWMNCIVNFHSKGQSKLKDASGPVGGMKTYEVGYKDDFCTDLIITVYDTFDDVAAGAAPTERPANAVQATPSTAAISNKIMTAKAYRAFPKLLPSFDLSWGSNDEFVRLQIPFTYTDFDVEYHQVSSPTEPTRL